MRKSLRLIFASLIVIGGMSMVSFAQNHKPKVFQVNKRQENQQKRIYQGIASGELTRREAARLEQNQREIYRDERRYRRSGDGLSNRERVKLAHEQNQASRSIYRQKHDEQDRPEN